MARLRRLSRDEPVVSDDLLDSIRSLSRPLNSEADLDPLMERIGNARCVMLGEASHGTHEYYAWRAALSRRLIREKGFRFIAVEGDWPDCYRVNRYVKGFKAEDPAEVLRTFSRWPTWMWANREIAELIAWMRLHNEDVPESGRVGFYGLDVYSLWDSLHQLHAHLRKTGGRAAEAARAALRCFEPYGEDEQEYAHASRWVPETCEDEVIELLRAVRAQERTHAGDGRDAHFAAEQNALVIRNAEAYYRAMVRSGPDSWNVRDRHVDETLARLMDFHGHGAKAIVWAHNTHVGDARHTDMADDGMVNIGQLARERFGDGEVVLIGFATYEGGVIAGEAWEAPLEEMTVPPARGGSWDDLLHQCEAEDRLLIFDRSMPSEWHEPRGQRAIGVVYRPEYERYGNYVPTVLPRRYDALLYLDHTQALSPLHVPESAEHEAPETFPSGV